MTNRFIFYWTGFLSLVILALMVFGFVHVENQIKAIKIPQVIVKTVNATQPSTSMTCTGTVRESLSGQGLPINSVSPDSTLLGSNINLSGSTPVNLTCSSPN